MMSLRQVRFIWEMLRYVGVSATAELSVLPAITSCNVQLKYMWTNNLIIKKIAPSQGPVWYALIAKLLGASEYPRARFSGENN